MLIMFRAKNFMSFKDEVILDLRATSYKQHPTHVIDLNGKLKVLKTTAIYGANASGKSNLISAMFFFENYIFKQFYSIIKNENDDMSNLPKIELDPFILEENNNNISEFEIIFYYNGRLFQYGFECSSERVINEWYFIDDKKVFERVENHVTYGSEYQRMLKPYSKVPSERLYLSVLEYFLDDIGKVDILNDFMTFMGEEYNVYFEIFFETSIKKVGGIVNLKDRIKKDEKYRKKVEEYLKKIDVGICGLIVEEKNVINSITSKEEPVEVVKTIHNIYNSEGEVVGQRQFDLIQESTGTLRFLSYIQNIIDMTERGGVFIVDEMSARLHPLLTKLIVDIFQSSSNTKAQLIFTTHDISLLNNTQFRRDEIVFIDKDYMGVSRLFALSDKKVREDATFSKDYLQGKYGAIPIFDYDGILGGD